MPSSPQKNDDAAARGAALKTAVEFITKKFGDDAIQSLHAAGKMKVETVPSGSFSLDIALGGGIPRGRILEIYGPESSGKTTMTLHAAAEVQKTGGVVAFIDAEHALDPEYAAKIGLDLEKCLISQPDSGEQALEITEQLVRSGAVDFIVVDSVAALTPRAEIEGDMGDAHVGLQARLMSQALRKITSVVAKSRCSVVFINQIRMKIGVMFGSPETTAGGNALKFYSSVRMDIRRLAKIETGTGDEKQAIGNRVRVKVVKNKVAPPFRQAEFDILFNRGIDRVGDLLELGVRYGLVKKAGAFFELAGEKFQGKAKAVERLGGDAKLMAQLEKAVRERAFSNTEQPEQAEQKTA